MNDRDFKADETPETTVTFEVMLIMSYWQKPKLAEYLRLRTSGGGFRGRFTESPLRRAEAAEGGSGHVPVTEYVAFC